VDEGRARELLAAARERIEASLADREVEEGLAERMRDELAAVGRAEQRIEQGTYGVSVESGEPIPDARLEAIPWAERTAEEEQRRVS
jgi:DnaK suppressor protein